MDMNREKNSSKNMDSLSEFIREHYDDDPDRLALQKAKWPEIDVAAAVSTLLSRRKLSRKAPLWATTDGLVLPRTLSAEQCSGEATARHKALAIREFLGKQPWRIADLTGGLGVDCLEFSNVAEAVLYNEMLPELAEAAEHNFRVLGARNIEISCFEASPVTLGGATMRTTNAGNDVPKGNGIKECDKSNEGVGYYDGGLRERLERFHPNVIFLDPARRDGCGKKVFLLEDCSPDILRIKAILLEIAPVLVLKLSPMADISMVLERLGNECRELQIIESGGECKELLVLMRRNVQVSGQQDGCLIRVYNLDAGNLDAGDLDAENLDAGNINDRKDSPVFEFHRDEENDCTGPRLTDSAEIVPGALLFEPGKALMKAGCFRLIGQRFGASALGRDTHYYILRENTPDTATATSSATNISSATGREHFGGRRCLKDSGKLFRILDIAEMSGKELKEFGKRHPEAEVTARNVRMTSEELRRRLGCKPSDRHHIFALHADTSGKNLLLFTERI